MSDQAVINALRTKRVDLAGELQRADVSYKDLADRLTAHGLEETEVGIASTLARGTFSATFVLACLAVLGLKGASLDDL